MNDQQREIADAFVGFKNEPVKGVVVMADSLFNDLRDDVVRYANASGLPTIYQWKEFVDVGGLISFGPDIVEAYGKAGEYVKSILLGKSPATMPCSKPSGFKVYLKSRNSATIEYLTNPDNAAWPSCPSDLAAFFPTARRAIPLAKASRDPQGDVRYWHLADIDLCAANVCF